MMQKSCVFLTMEDPSGFFVYDHLTHAPLATMGWNVIDVPWSRPVQDWSVFDAVVIRSPWDYQSDPHAFLETLEAIESAGVRLFNSSEICRWNIDKTYLRDLDSRGVPTIPTTWLKSFDREHLISMLGQSGGSDRLVLKPLIGAGADDVFVLTSDIDRRWEMANQVYKNCPVMVQPFLQSIISHGEYSLFYFASRFSHAIIKTPAEGDFRVQEEHGGTIRSVIPHVEILRVGEKAVEAVGETLLYARVDVVELYDGSFAVIELELIEPSLYFPYDERSPIRFANALDKLVGQSNV